MPSLRVLKLTRREGVRVTQKKLFTAETQKPQRKARADRGMRRHALTDSYHQSGGRVPCRASSP